MLESIVYPSSLCLKYIDELIRNCHAFSCSVVGEEARSLHGQRSAFAAIIAGAPATALAVSGASALPGGLALLGTEEVVGLGEAAVVAVTVGVLSFSVVSIGGEVVVPEHLGVVEIEHVELVLVLIRDRDGRGSGDKGSNKFHFLINKKTKTKAVKLNAVNRFNDYTDGKEREMSDSVVYIS